MLGKYTWREDWTENNAPSLDSVLDFNFCFSAREYLRHPGTQYGSPAALEKSLLTRQADGPDGRPYFNPNPGPDGLNSRQKMITFIENHDGLNRFRVSGVTEERNRLAQGLLMTMPGIPCLYYGTEHAMPDDDAKTGWDSESGRKMFLKRKDGPSVRDVRKSAAFREISDLAKLRARMPALRDGIFVPLWVDSGDSSDDDGVFAFGRGNQDGSQFVVVVINASDQPRVTGAGEHALRIPDFFDSIGRVLRPVLTIGAGKNPETPGIETSGGLRLPVPASSMVIYEGVPAVN
jgi:glycosidase